MCIIITSYIQITFEELTSLSFEYATNASYIYFMTIFMEYYAK